MLAMKLYFTAKAADATSIWHNRITGIARSSTYHLYKYMSVCVYMSVAVYSNTHTKTTCLSCDLCACADGCRIQSMPSFATWY